MKLNKRAYLIDITWTYPGEAYTRTEQCLIHTGVEQQMKAAVRRFIVCDMLREITAQRFGRVKTFNPVGEEGCTIRAELVARSALTLADFNRTLLRTKAQR